MDEAVTDRTNSLRALALGWLALLAAGAATPAAGQALPDPTRPPAAFQVRQGGPSAAVAAAERRAPRLQSVLIARQPGGRHIAVIDGETLRLGDLYRGARVARIAQDEVELVRGRTRQVLKLDGPAAVAPGRTPAQND